MALETVTHISDLVVTNPTSTDPKSEGDNHLRNIKTALKTDFPNISGVVTKTHTQLNNTLDKTGDTMTGNLNFSGTGLRLTGDFSNATVANRLMLQTSTVNDATRVGFLPNGTSTASQLILFNSSSDPANAGLGTLRMNNGDFLIAADRNGAGAYLPMTFAIGGANRMVIDTSGNVLVTGSGGLGYGTGSGGTVTQATSKTTAVTLNKPTGQITMNNAALGAGASAAFQLNNTLIEADDTLVVSLNATFSINNYRVTASVGGSAAIIRVENISAGSLSEAILINFSVLKGATS